MTNTILVQAVKIYKDLKVYLVGKKKHSISRVKREVCNMKLFAFALREYDEKAYLEKICSELNIEYDINSLCISISFS